MKQTYKFLFFLSALIVLWATVNKTNWSFKNISFEDTDEVRKRVESFFKLSNKYQFNESNTKNKPIVVFININQKKISKKEIERVLPLSSIQQIVYYKGQEDKTDIKFNSDDSRPSFFVDSIYTISFARNGIIKSYKNHNLSKNQMDELSPLELIVSVFQFNKLDIEEFQMEEKTDDNHTTFTYKRINAEINFTETLTFQFYHNRLKTFDYQYEYQSSFSHFLFSGDRYKSIAEMVFIIFLFFAYLFYYIKLSHQGLLNLKNNIPFALIFLCFFLLKFLDNRPETSYEIIIGMTISGIFIFIVLIFSLATSDYLARQKGNNRMVSVDLLRKNKFFNNIISENIGDAFLFAGILLYNLMFFFFISTKLHLYSYQTWFSINELYSTDFPIIKIISDVLNHNTTVQVMFSIILVYILEKHVRKPKYRLILFTVTWCLFLAYDGIAGTTYFSTLLQLPYSLINGFVFYQIITKRGYLASYLTSFLFFIASSGIPLIITLPSQFLNHFILIGAIVVLFIYMIVSHNRKIQETEMSFLVPDYINNIIKKERFKNELEAARTIQENFLPKNHPRSQRIDISTYCRPALEVGGDYYDVFPLQGEKIGIAIGDVSGKGISAAFYMTLAKGFIQAISRYENSPSQTLIKTNELFYSNVDRGHFISMVYGILDPKSLKFHFVRAGHNPPLYYSASKRAFEWLKPDGIAIGLDSGSIFSQKIKEYEIQLEKEDILILYTDGLTEATNYKNRELTEKRLMNIVSETIDNNAENIMSHIIKKTDDFVGSTIQHDDMTIIIIKGKEA